MDDLLGEFLTETTESLDLVDAELVKFEQEPNNADILDNIFRLVHTIKGTCGFLGLPRLGGLAHAAESLMGKYREGAEVTEEGVSLILETIDRLKEILELLEENQEEPAGDDNDLISQLDHIAEGGEKTEETPSATDALASDAAPSEPAIELPDQQPEREVKAGEVSLDELEMAFQNAPGPDDLEIAPDAAASFAAEAKAENELSALSEKKQDKKNKKAKAAEKNGKEAASGNAKKDGSVKAQTIRVNVETLEHLMTMVSELVLTRNQLLEMVRRHDDSEFKVPLQRLSNVTVELQEGVMKTRMQPIGNAWQKLPRIVRDLSLELDKKIDLQMIGAETELDRQVLEMIKDPLTHIVRNSADHGLEDTVDRLQLGKPETGRITLSAYHEGGQIIIKIVDDGRGLDADKIKAKAIQNELATESELDNMSENQIHKLIFHAGFSTAANVTSVSGRGVGMDVVRTNVELIGGTVDLHSVQGQGTTLSIKIPLTLAIVSALIVEVAGQRYAIPQLSVSELVRAHKNAEHRIEMINESPVLRLRNKLLPVIHLSNILNLKLANGGDPNSVFTNMDDRGFFVVVTQVGAQTFGVVVDSVFHTEEIVVKPMSSMLRDITMFSGNTILGDGSVIMIIDPNGIAQTVATENTAAEASAEIDQAVVAEEDSITTLLVFRAGSDEPKAVPLSLVTRLEEIELDRIERVNGRDLVQYRGALMPLVHIDGQPPARREGQRTQPVLVFADDDRAMGLAVDEIVDIVEDRLDIEIASDHKGVIGSAVIKGRATELIDIGHYLPQAFDDWLERKDRLSQGVQRDLDLLLVDDSAFFRNMLAPLLSAAGYRVTLADSAEEALAMKERSRNFDLIVSDIEMPGMDGIAFAEALKGDLDWGETPIIALSSHAEPHIVARSKEAGFHDYVGKFDREGLIETLNECKTRAGVAA